MKRSAAILEIEAPIVRMGAAPFEVKGADFDFAFLLLLSFVPAVLTRV